MMIVLPDEKECARQAVFQRVRFYACPYFVYQTQKRKERGVLFMQSDSTLAEMSLPIPVLSNGRKMTKIRSVFMIFLTMEEYDKELCRDDFELATVRSNLKLAIEEYDEKKQIALMMRFRCGHISVGVTTLVPDFKLCSVLGKEYYANAPSGAVQLNIDDH